VPESLSWQKVTATRFACRHTPIHPLRRLLVLKVRTLLILIAVIGVELGWEIVAWRNWHLREMYRALAGDNAQHEMRARELLRHVETMLAVRQNEDSGWFGANPEARVAERAYRRDRFGRDHEYYSSLVAYYSERRGVYRAAVKNISSQIPPAPSHPGDRPRATELVLMLSQKQYAQALARCSELIERYPDLVQAHERRAWILSTCPDALLRDGKLAVESPTRAAELTNWKNFLVLSTLAAAYAESRDFALAVRWEEEAQTRRTASGDRAPYDHERLALYKSRKPYRGRP
jgi:tetratricopeptide (TPR) repeat protein